jgi:rod shape-determining protein MreD
MGGMLYALDRAFTVCLPGFVTIAAMMILAALTPLPRALVPDIVMMLVYLGAAFRGDAFPVWLCFAVGLLSDLLGSTPVGLHAIAYLIVHAFAAIQRRHMHLVLLQWSGFVLVCLAAGVAQWLVMSAYFAGFLDPKPLLTNIVITALIFPVLSFPLQWLIQGEANAQQRI